MKAYDVSYCQRGLQLTSLEADYIIIKATQACFCDPCFTDFATQAVANRIPFGLYHFLTAVSPAESVRQAEYFLAQAEPYRAYSPYLYLDCEVYGLPMEGLSKSALTDVVIVFLESVKDAGFIPVLYSNPDHLECRLDKSRIVGHYPLWVACWGGKLPSYKGMIGWQKGEDNGVDVDEMFFSDAQYAILSIAAKNFLNNPAYWLNNFNKCKWLGQLFINADEAYSGRWKQSEVVDYALTKLVRDGVVQNREYWERILRKPPIKYIDRLFLALGGGVLRD